MSHPEAQYVDPLYVAARRVLLDALEALSGQLPAVILVGAHAVYIRAGDADLGTTPFTTDAAHPTCWNVTGHSAMCHARIGAHRFLSIVRVLSWDADAADVLIREVSGTLGSMKDRQDTRIVPGEVSVRGLVFPEGGRWAALVLDFDIAVVESTPEGAVEAALRTSRSYVEECQREGKSYRQMQRPAPLRYWLRFTWLTVWHGVFRRLRGGSDTFQAPIAAAY